MLESEMHDLQHSTAPQPEVESEPQPQYLSPKKTRRIRFGRVALVILLLLVLWPVGDLMYETVGAETDHAVPADVIVVLGCHIFDDNNYPSACIRARASHTADLYERGLAKWIIATGYPSTNGGPSEATVLEEVMVSEGVPRSAIVKEEQALNTIQNIQNSQAIMQQRGWNTAILVTEPFHIKRATLIADDSGLKVYPSPAIDSANWNTPQVRLYNLAKDTLSLMLYQVKRVLGIRD